MEVKADSPSDKAPEEARARWIGTTVLVLVLCTPGVCTWLFSRARPALATEVPALMLDAGGVAAQRTRDVAQAARAPESDAATERREAYHECNRAELDVADRPSRAQRRRDRLIAALAAVEQEHGAESRAALRAADLERAMLLLRGQGEGERDAELGGLVGTLERYGMVQGGRQHAPAFVVRTAFKARWNAQHDRPLTEELGPLELRAYWGWLALEAETAPLEHRLTALGPYAEAGGTRDAEARGALLLQAGRRDEAAEAFEVAYRAAPSFRLRNHALAARSQ